MLEKLWDYLIDGGIATEEELKLITYINGYNIDSLNSVLYVRTAFRNLKQILEADEC